VSSRSIRRIRALLVLVLIAWFVSPPDWRYAVPLWLPFLLAVALEVEFAVVGWRRIGRTPRAERGRAPLRIDLERFGWGDEEPPDEDDPAYWSSPPVPRRPTALIRRIGATAAVLAFVVLVAWGVGVRRGWSSLDRGTQAKVERVLSQEAGRIAGHTAVVHCDTAGRHVGAVQEADGLAEVGGRSAWVTPGVCFRLERVIDGHDTRGSFSSTGRALAVLAHESWHLQGVADEGIANCYAFQSGVGVGVRLGLTRSTAEAMMREQFADNASDSAGSPRYLVAAGCENGGRYDLHPSSARFP
jgi:hypothetical protein